ncbi:protein HEATR9 [Rhynchocyon petersi]
MPYCYFQQPKIYSPWHTLYDPREVQKILQKRRDHSRHIKEKLHLQKLHLPMNKLTLQSQVASKPLGPISDPLKWQRLKELTESLKSPIEEEQRYAAQALGCLGISDKFILEALREVVKTGTMKVKSEACRTLALLGCLNKHVIHALIQQLKGCNEAQRMETLVGLRMALNKWVAVPKEKRIQVEDEGKLVSLLQRLMNVLPIDEALEAALCLGFLRPCSKVVQEFLLQCLGQGPKTQQMKALWMLVKMMHVHSAVVIRAILEQLSSSAVLEHRLEANNLLRTIGLEAIQGQGLEGLTFDLLRKMLYNEPFLALRKAVAETVEKLKMKPLMMNLVEAQLMDPSASTRQEAIISLGALGIRSPQVYHLLLDMLDVEKNQNVKNSLQKTLILLGSTDAWIQKKLKNKVLFVYEPPVTRVKPETLTFWKEPESPEELTIQDFRLAKLRPLFTTKYSAKTDQEEKLTAKNESVSQPTINSDTAFTSVKPVKGMPWVKGPWELRTLL